MRVATALAALAVAGFLFFSSGLRARTLPDSGRVRQRTHFLVTVSSSPRSVMADHFRKWFGLAAEPGRSLAYVSACLASILLLMTAGLGRYLRSWRSGVAAAGLLATTCGFWDLARAEIGYIDKLSFLLGSLCGGLLAADKGKPWGWVVGGTLLGGAMLSGDLRDVLVMGGWLGCWRLTLGRASAFPWRGFLFAGLLAVAWVVYARQDRLIEDGWDWIGIVQTLRQILLPSSSRCYGFWVGWSMAFLLPWGLLLIPAILARLPKRREGGKAEALLLGWMAVPLVVYGWSDPVLVLSLFAVFGSLLVVRMLDGRFGDEPHCAPWAGNLMWLTPAVMAGIALAGFPPLGFRGLFAPAPGFGDRIPEVMLLGCAAVELLALRLGSFVGVVGGGVLGTATVLCRYARWAGA